MGLANTGLFTECSNHHLGQVVRTHQLWRGGKREEGRGEVGEMGGEGRELNNSVCNTQNTVKESNKQVTHKQHTRQSRDERWSE